MGTGNSLSTEILNFIFTATPASWAANANCYVALHTADPQDLKGSITTYTKDGAASGHFNVANANVIQGCVITFADLSTATIIGKTGDGTASGDIALSVDHATDAALVKITGSNQPGVQTTSEVAYTTYARVAVVRTSSGWTVASQVSANAALITFPLCTAGTSTATHFSVGRDASGAGEIWFSAPLNAPLAISVNVTPQFSIGALTVTEL